MGMRLGGPAFGGLTPLKRFNSFPASRYFPEPTEETYVTGDRSLGQLAHGRHGHDSRGVARGARSRCTRAGQIPVEGGPRFRRRHGGSGDAGRRAAGHLDRDQRPEGRLQEDLRRTRSGEWRAAPAGGPLPHRQHHQDFHRDRDPARGGKGQPAAVGHPRQLGLRDPERGADHCSRPALDAVRGLRIRRGPCPGGGIQRQSADGDRSAGPGADHP